MLKPLAFVTVLLAAACGGSPKATGTAGTAEPTRDVLAIGEMKLIDVNKDQALLIHADGSVELDGKKFAKVTTDGKLAKYDTGEVGFTLKADGTVTAADGKDLGAKISADGVLSIGDKTISISESGEIVGGNPDAPKMKVAGATSGKLKRTAMFVLLVMITSEPGSDAEVKSGTP